MQQYRLNFSLLIGLCIGALVATVAVYGLWKFQIERNSKWLISEARRAHDAKDVRNSVQFYQQYLAIHPADLEARGEAVNGFADMTELNDVTIPEMREALGNLEVTLRNKVFAKTSAAPEARKRLAKIYTRVGNTSAALDHISLLLEEDPGNAEYQSMRAENLALTGDINETVKYSYQLIGYDPKADKFDIKTAKAPNDPKVYVTLASMIHDKQNKPELAGRILKQMVDANPKSADAYVQRGTLEGMWGHKDEARSDSEKSLKLKPDDLDVLLLAANVANDSDDYDKATEYIAKAKKLYPDDFRCYQAALRLEIKQQITAKGEDKDKYYQQALAQIDEGLKAVPASKQIELLIYRIELQLQKEDLKAARQSLDDLRNRRNLRPEFLDYYDARILLAEQKWFPASEAFFKIRSQMEGFNRERKAEIDYNLGLCYEHLGRLDMAKNQYSLVLEQNPQNAPAKAGLQRVDAMRGMTPDDKNVDPLQKAMVEELKKPQKEQNWTKIDEMFQQMAKNRQLDETTTKIFQAQMMAMRQDYDGAAKQLSEAKASAPKNLAVQRAIVQLARANPKIGPERALNVLKNAVAQFGDLPILRIDKADILIQMNKGEEQREQLKQQLAELMTGTDSWTPVQKAELCKEMAGRYLALNMTDEARQNLQLAADSQPNELTYRLALFALAQDAGDDAGMKEAQAKILEIVKDKNDSAWLYTEARRQLILYRTGKTGPDALKQIRSLAKQAMADRREWFELYALLAEVELLANNPGLALEYFDKAEQLGRPTPNLVATHIRLLVSSGRYQDAGRLLERIPEQLRQALLGPLYAEVLYRSNQTEAALKQAEAATKAEPNNASAQYWYGQLLARSAQAPENASKRKELMADSIHAMQKATEIQPEFPEAWFALINYFMMDANTTEAQKEANLKEAQKALRDAQLAMTGDDLQIFLARSYEVLHRWFDAETMYRQLYDAQPDNVGRAQQLAAFYAGPLYQRQDRYEKVAPLINQILKAGADNKIPASDGNLLWARRTAAKMLASTREYPKLVDAEKLLASNSQDGLLLVEDKLSMAEILASRPEPRSRLTAIGLLEDVSKNQKLNDRAETQLGELYSAVGADWLKYKSQMEKTTSRFPSSVEARQSYADRLLTRGDQRSLEDAAVQINKLRELAPASPVTLQLTVRLAAKLGKQQQVRDDLVRKIPKVQDIKDLDENQARSLTTFANLLIDLGDVDSAEKLYTDLANRVPALQYDLARFLGEHRDPDKCFAKLRELYKPDNVSGIVTIALGVARSQRDKVKDKFDADIQHWIDTGLRENPDSAPLLIAQADLFDLEKNYKAAADTYHKLLERKDLDSLRRAVVLNNMAFLLALDKTAQGGPDDPLKLIEEASQIMGPNSDILDTRAVVRTAQGDYKGAIADLNLSVTDNPTPSKYYHKAVAHFKNGQRKEAIDAWEKAEGLGLTRDVLNRMEFEQYDELKKEIDQLRKKPITQAEPLRKAS